MSQKIPSNLHKIFGSDGILNSVLDHAFQDIAGFQLLPDGALVDAPYAIVAGSTISQWAEQWTTWGLQAPADTNPLTDPNGMYASVNNYGPVFFIAGTSNTPPGSPTVERSFDVPAGKPILVPLVTGFDTEGPNIPATIPPLNPNYKQEVNAVLQGWDANATAFASIDGAQVQNIDDHKIETDFFSMGAVKEGSLVETFGVAPGTPLDTTKAVGYWLMIDGLSKGAHTLDFGGSITNAYLNQATHVIDHINVV